MFIHAPARLAKAARAAVALMAYGVPILLTPGPARSQDDSLAPAALRSAVAEAWSRHPEAAATQALLDASAARADAASRPLYNPELELNADDEGPDRSATAGLGITLDLSGKRSARAAVGRAGADVAAASALQRRREFARSWLEAWSSTSAASRRASLGAEQVTLLDHAAQLAEQQLRAGDISRLDRDFAFLARDEAAAEQATLIAELASAQAKLRSLDPQLVATPVADFPASEPAAAEPSDASFLESLPEWRAAVASEAGAQAQVRVAERERIADPTLSVRAGSIELTDGARDNLYGITVSVPLFVRNSYRAELVAARAEARAAAADLERLRFELQAAATRAAATHRAVRDAWLQWQQSPGTNVQSRADLLERLWRAGELSTSDYLLQLKQTIDTALAGAELEGRVWSSFTDYLVATGRLDAWLGLDSDKGN